MIYDNLSRFCRECGAAKELSGWRVVYYNGRRMMDLRDEHYFPELFKEREKEKAGPDP